ncbi:MAG: M16 family metallopeptidase [Vicinamibacterales bacterium]
MSVDRRQLPSVGPEVAVRFPGWTRTTLRSGLTLWTVTRSDVPLLTLMAIVPAGSASDPEGQEGLAALVADLLDEGSGTRDAIAIHEALGRLGGQLETDAGYDSTSVVLATLSRFLPDAASLLADIVFRPRLDSADFERVRQLRCHRLQQMKDVPAALAERVVVGELFAGHPYGHLPIGTEASLRALDTETVKDFHRRHYALSGTLMIAVGDATHEEVADALESAVADVERQGHTAYERLAPMAGATGERRLIIVDRPGAPQSELRVGHLAVNRASPDYHALVVLNAVLGGQFVSRINLNLREDKGYTYGARSGFDWRRAIGPFVVQTSVQTDATAAATSEILKEMQEILSVRPPTGQEIALAQASLTRGYARNFETLDQIVRALAQLAIYDLPESWYDDFVDHVRAVSEADALTAGVRHIRPDAALVVVVGDAAQVRAGVEALGFASTRVVPSAVT